MNIYRSVCQLWMIVLILFVSADGVFAANHPLKRDATSAAVKTSAQNADKPAARNYRPNVLSEMQRLILLCQRTSFKLRKSIERLKKQGRDTGPYSNLANKYDEMASFLKRKQLAIRNSSRTYTSRDMQFIKQISKNMQDDMDKINNFDIQETMSRATQAAALMAAANKKLDEAKKGIANNLGGDSDDPDD